MLCKRCGNQDIYKMGKLEDRWYCRECITFGRLFIGEEDQIIPLKKSRKKKTTLYLPFKLTALQEDIARKIESFVNEGQSVLLEAITGAGKTEMVTYAILSQLIQQNKVCFAIPRTEVVKQVYERYIQYFPNSKVIAVYGGHHEFIDGDLIVCTTHQLYRYINQIDLLIIDEPDAFPFKNHRVLNVLSAKVAKKSMIYLSATPDEQLINDHKLQKLYVYSRPHQRALIVPKLIVGGQFRLLLAILIFLKKQNQLTILFVPTIHLANLFYHVMSYFMPCALIHSRTKDKDHVLKMAQNKSIQVLISTTILERGITLPKASVIIYQANHAVFDHSSIVQMLGRVGRSKEDTQAQALILCDYYDLKIKAVIDKIHQINRVAESA